jgi:hypothetical protein
MAPCHVQAMPDLSILVCRRIVTFVLSHCVQAVLPMHGMVSGARPMIRKLKSGEYRLYSRKVDPRTGRRRNLGTFGTRAAAEQHERAIQFFKRRR